MFVHLMSTEITQGTDTALASPLGGWRSIPTRFDFPSSTPSVAEEAGWGVDRDAFAGENLAHDIGDERDEVLLSLRPAHHEDAVRGGVQDVRDLPDLLATQGDDLGPHEVVVPVLGFVEIARVRRRDRQVGSPERLGGVAVLDAFERDDRPLALLPNRTDREGSVTRVQDGANRETLRRVADDEDVDLAFEADGATDPSDQ
jgi:hypothetical protein